MQIVPFNFNLALDALFAPLLAFEPGRRVLEERLSRSPLPISFDHF